MGSFNANILPATAGLSLGNLNQPWQLHLTDAFGDTLQSNTAAVAQSGFVRLASGDFIAWRNSTNTADVTLSKTSSAATTTPADTLVFSGSGIEGPFISNSLNPASAGELRLATGDQIVFRNNANGGDVVGLQHNTDDTVTVGGAAGITTVTETVTGTLAAGAISSLASSDLPIAPAAVVSTGKSLTLTGGAGGGTGGTVVIAGGAAAPSGVTAGGAVYIRGGSGNSLQGDVIVGDSNTRNVDIGQNSSSVINIVGKFSKYQNVTTVNGGIPSEVASVVLSGQTAAITTATLFSVVTAGQYRVSWNAKITTAGSTSSTLGALTIAYTDPDTVTVTLTSAAVIAAGTVATTSTANTTGTALIGIPQLLNCEAGTDITYAFAYASNSANEMTYNLNIVLEAL